MLYTNVPKIPAIISPIITKSIIIKVVSQIVFDKKAISRPTKILQIGNMKIPTQARFAIISMKQQRKVAMEPTTASISPNGPSKLAIKQPNEMPIV